MAGISATRTLMIDLRRLELTGEDGVLTLRLMRAANDLAAANAGYRNAGKGFSRLQRHMEKGIRRYYVRLQCGHLAEAMHLIAEINQRPRLLDLIERCSSEAQAAFGRLVACTKRHPKRKDFERYIISLRHQVAFHYDAGVTEQALKRRAAHEDMRYSILTLGSNIDLWRFNVADDIELSIVARILWAIPDDADVQAEDDRISGFGSGLCLDFIQFAGEVGERFLVEHALA